MKRYIITGCLVVLISAGNIFAQAGFNGQHGFRGQQGFTGQPGGGFTGPSGSGMVQPVMINQPISVNEAKNLPHDSWIVLSGNIVNMLPGGRQYTFRDATGDIIVDIGPKEWRGLSVDVSDKVGIYGEFKSHRGLIHVKAHAISGNGKVTRLPGQPVTETAPVTVNEARSLPHDSWVVLNGNIVNSLTTGKHNYTFRDSTGEIMVDIGRKEWRGLSVGVSDRVEIYGEIKHHRGMTNVKVRAIRTGA